MTEIWKPALGYSKFYEVSNLGHIRLLHAVGMRSDGKPYTTQPKILQPYVNKLGYEQVGLHWDVDKHYLVHRLIMETFCPVDNMKQLQVNHIDGNKSHNELSNLEWATREQNMQHAMKTGLWVPTYANMDINPNLKLHQKEIDEIRQLLAEGKLKQYEIAEMYGVQGSVISTIKHNKRRFAHT